MRTLVSSKWKFDGVKSNKLCFVSRIYEDEVLLCGATCKYVDDTTGNVAIIRTSDSGHDGYEAQWTYSTLRKAAANLKALTDVYQCINN